MDKLFDKLIHDRLSPSELKELRERFNAASDEELTTMFADRDIDDVDADMVSQQIIDETKAKVDNRLFGGVSMRRTPLRKFLLRVAAVLLPLIVIGGAIWLYVGNTSDQEAGLCTVATNRNETSSLTLADGTVVKINGNSVFSFPSGFRKDSRQVTFDGEAYFEVAKNAKAPFTITTPVMTVTVKGTAFNLLSRTDAAYSELSLDNGSVTITQTESGRSVDLKPGNKAIIDNATGEITVKPINAPANTSSWTEMELTFDNASPAYLIDRIEQNYEIELDPKVKASIDENFTGSLPANDLDAALRIITRIYHN